MDNRITAADHYHRALGRGHAELARRVENAGRALARGQRGQGTVEYIGLVLLLAAVMAIVVKTGKGGSIANSVIKQVKQAIDTVG